MIKIKHFICILIFSYYSFAQIYAQTELEAIWDKAIAHSVDVAYANLNIKNATELLKNKRSLYPINVKINTESSFNDITENITWYPSNVNASIVISKTNPWGNSISGSIIYGIGRNIFDLLKEIDAKNIGYYHSPEISLTMEQSLLPYIFQGYSKNPEIQILQNKISDAEYSKAAIELSLKQNVANLYIQDRNILRQINMYKNTLAYYDEKIKAYYELNKSDQVSLYDVWNLENKKWEYYKEYIDFINSKNSIELSLNNLCGESVNVTLSNSYLPDSEKTEIEYNTSLKKLNLEIEDLTLQNVISKQTYAPKLTLGGTFSETTDALKNLNVNYIKDKSSFNWNFSLGISFTEFLSPSKKLRQSQYEDNILLYLNRIKNMSEELQRQIENYTKLINSYQSQIEQLKTIIDNKKKFKDDYEILYKKGNCSKLEFEEVKLSVIEAECMYKNYSDYLWLYKWMRTQCR